MRTTISPGLPDRDLGWKKCGCAAADEPLFRRLWLFGWEHRIGIYFDSGWPGWLRGSVSDLSIGATGRLLHCGCPSAGNISGENSLTGVQQ